MKYTADDVWDALLAQRTDEDAPVQEMEPLAYLCMMNDSRATGEEEYQNYLNGKKILEKAKLITTTARYDVTNQTAHRMEAQRLLERGAQSPVIEYYLGYTASNQMATVYALKDK